MKQDYTPEEIAQFRKDSPFVNALMSVSENTQNTGDIAATLQRVEDQIAKNREQIEINRTLDIVLLVGIGCFLFVNFVKAIFPKQGSIRRDANRI